MFAAGLYAVVTVAMMPEIVRHPATTVAMDVGDPVLVAAILEWNATALPLSPHWWNFPTFDPALGITAFTEHLLGLWPITSPIVWITGNPLVAYNAAFRLSFPLAATATFALAYSLTASIPGAFVAGAAFAFAPYRGNHLSHLQMLISFGMPLALLGLHQYVATGRRRGLVYFAGGWLCAVLSNSYMLVCFGVFVGCWVLWFGTTRETIRRVPLLVLVGLLAMVPVIPIIVGYLDIHSRYLLTRSLSEIAIYSADVTGVLHPSPYSTVSSAWLASIISEGAIFPGLTISLLALIGTTWRPGPASPAGPSTRLDRALLMIGVVFLAATAIAAATDVRFNVLGLRVSLRTIDRPLIVAALALSIWGWRNRSLLRRRPRWSSGRSPVAFYAVMAVLMWLFSLGPVARVNGREWLSGLPYAWLLHVPGVAGLRAPARFWVLATLALSVLVAFGVSRLGRGRTRWVVAAAAAAAIVLEGWVHVTAIPLNPFPSVAPDEANAVVLELPADRPEANTEAMLRATTGGYSTLNGYSGYEVPHFVPMSAGLQLRDEAVITELRRRTALYVSVRSDNGDGWRGWLTRTYGDAQAVRASSERALYRLSKLEYTPPVVGRVIPFTVQSVSCGKAFASFVADGSLDTRWHCGEATVGQQITLDAREVTTLSAVAPALGPYPTDTPRHLRVETSMDGARWDMAWSGPGWAAAMRAGWTDPTRMELLIPFSPVRARYVRLTQLGEPSLYYWSIAEVRLFE